MHQSAARSRLLRCTATAALMLAANAAQAQSALPTGGTVTTGTATIASDAISTTVTQTSNRATVNFTSFDVAQGNNVRFNQPDATAATLARVTGTAGSTIAGQVTATGALYLVNPNGIAITSTGTVQTGGGFVASTLNITDANFNAGTNSFAGTGSSAPANNAGSIAASGFAALLGGTVSNAGTISVPAGRIALGSGEAITLDINGANFLQVSMPTGATAASGKALIENDGTITGGRIELTGASAADAVRSIVNMNGTINADSATGNGGTILLSATGGGGVAAQGTASARATGASGNGGTITLAGGTVTYAVGFADTTAMAGTTGTAVLRVPGSFSDSVSGRLTSLLAKNNVSIVAGGDITTPTLSWHTSNALSLTAGGNIVLNAIAGTSGTLNLSAGGGVAYTGSITNTNGVGIGTFNLTNGNWAQNAATLPSFAATDFRFDVTKATFLRVTGGAGTSDAPYTVADAYGLQGIASGKYLANSFVLANAIDASGTKNWNAGAGFVPIGTDGKGNVWSGTAFPTNGSGSTGFTGSINGFSSNGTVLAITGLTENRTTGYNGLVGYATGAAALTNLSLTGVSITGGGNTGALVGFGLGQTISNVGVGGAVTGGAGTGGLAGLTTMLVVNSHSDATVTAGYAASDIGGLVGVAAATMTNVYATGAVTAPGAAASANIGGLIGRMAGGTVTTAAANGGVSVTGAGGATNVGGLIGILNGGTLTGGSAGGAVGMSGTGPGAVNYVGGLVGQQTAGAIASSYATGNVQGAAQVGGLVGYQYVTGSAVATIAGSYANGTVTGLGGYVGGLVGQVQLASASSGAKASIDTSYATGKVTANASNYVGGLIGGTNGASGYLVSITNAYATGNVAGNASYAGGLIGNTSYTTLNTVSAAGAVSGTAYLGGLVGYANTGSAITAAYATGAVTATGTYIGGLVGYNFGAPINAAYATGAVTTSSTSGNSYVGGLVGNNSGTTSKITNAYASGAVSSQGGFVGGLVGYLVSGSIANAYATGSVTGNSIVGGLIGQSTSSTSVTGAYASGAVSGTGIVGGLIGFLGNSKVTNAYWDSYSTGRTTAFGSGTPGTTVTSVTSNPNAIDGTTAYLAASYANLPGATGLGSANAAGFVFLPGGTRPFLAFEVPVAGNPMVTTVNGAQTIANAHQLQLIGTNAQTLAANYRMTANIDLAETGRVVVGTPASYAGIWAGTGFVSLGTNGAGLTWDGTTYKSIGTITSGTYGFSGTLDGGGDRLKIAGATLSNLYINRPTANNIGLFGTLSGTVRGLNVGGTVTGGNGTGGLVGMMIGGPIAGTTGMSPTVFSISSSIEVIGLQVVGGLIGSATQRSSVDGTSIGRVTGTNTVGGLIGSANRATVIGNSSGAVSGQSYVGGLIGQQYGGTTRGTAYGQVTGKLAVGGFIGVLDGNGTATAYSINNQVSGPSSTDRNYGRVTSGSTAQTIDND